MKFGRIVAMVALALATGSASAQLVTWRGDLSDGVPQTAAMNGAAFAGGCAEFTASSSWHFWTFTANAGDVVTIDVDRVTAELDPYLALWSGNVTGDPLSDWTAADSSPNHTLLAWADDTDPAAVPGPYGDPRIAGYVAPATGTYTVLISGACSGAGSVSYGYSLRVTGSTADVCVAPAQLVVSRGDLTSGATQTAAINAAGFGGCAEFSIPGTWHFWTFQAVAGDSVTIDVDRVTGAFDPRISLWAGSLTGEPLADWTNANFGPNHTIYATADDTDAPAVPGPYGDPRIYGFVIPSTGTYTVLVSGSCSDVGPNAYAYAIDVSGSTAGQDSCRADFDNNGVVAVPDIFSFLSAWFANCP